MNRENAKLTQIFDIEKEIIAVLGSKNIDYIFNLLINPHGNNGEILNIEILYEIYKTAIGSNRSCTFEDFEGLVLAYSDFYEKHGFDQLKEMMNSF